MHGLRGLLRASGFAVLSVALLGGSCDKKEAHTAGDLAPVPAEIDAAPAAAVPETLPRGVDLKPLSPKQRTQWGRLAERLPSPCGKAHSLRTSVETDTSCARAPFAAINLARLVYSDLSDQEATEIWEERYKQKQLYEVDLAGSPREGDAGAPVTIVEFFDYGCPVCKRAVASLDRILEHFDGKVSVVFKHFPLEQHPQSMGAAMAAVAAHRQGKFLEYHHKLFDNLGNQSKEDLVRIARELGLDLARFEADMNAPASRAQVAKDRAEGDRIDIGGTPTLLVNGRMFTDSAADANEIRNWIEEELAVVNSR